MEFREALVRSIQPIFSRRTVASRRQMPAAQPVQVRAGQQPGAAPVPAAIPGAAPVVEFAAAEANLLPEPAETRVAQPIVEGNALFDTFFEEEEEDILRAEDAGERDENRIASHPEIWNRPNETQKGLSIVDYVLYGSLVFIVIMVIIILFS